MPINEALYGQSDTWNETLSQGIVWQSVLRELQQSGSAEKILGNANRKTTWLFVGCGTSFYLAESSAATWTLLTGEETRAVPGSEVLLYPKLMQFGGNDFRAVVISRSGQTSEAVRAARVLKRQMHIPTVGITCAQNTPLEAECDSTLVLRSADEKSTVMTRSFTSMLISLQYVAAHHAGNSAFIQSLKTMAEQFSGRIRSLSQELHDFGAAKVFEDYVFLGQGPFYGVAREAALKVMEMSCSYSQAFHTLEFRHGPKAIVTPQACLMFFLSQTSQQTESEVLVEMKEIGGVTIAVCNKADENIKSSADLVLDLNLPGEELTLLAPFVVSGQLLGFFTGVGKGLDPDQPKNLTRVVMLD
jgi:glucosamine--fructose-6-phosphate aminotransferase (isomerizing)